MPTGGPHNDGGLFRGSPVTRDIVHVVSPQRNVKASSMSPSYLVIEHNSDIALRHALTMLTAFHFILSNTL